MAPLVVYYFIIIYILVDPEILWLLMAIFRSVDVGHCLEYPPSWF